MALAPPELQEEIKRVLKTISAAAQENTRDFTRVEAAVRMLDQMFELDDAAIAKFALGKKFDEVAASLALRSGVSTQMMARLLEGQRSDLILIPCKAAGLGWAVVESILRNRPSKQRTGDEILRVASKDYGKLSLETAQRTLRFWQVHNKLEK